MSRKPNKTKQLAQLYGVTDRTVSLWAAAGAPLGDEQALDVWLAGRKQRVTKNKPASKSVPLVISGTAGAASALERLEQEELAAYAQLQKAIKDNDPLAQRSARDAWLKISGELRKYDLLVEQARRSSGELIPKEELIHCIKRMTYATRVALQTSKQAVVPRVTRSTDTMEVDKMLNELVADVWLASIKNLLGSKVPEWAKDCILEAAKAGLSKAEQGKLDAALN